MRLRPRSLALTLGLVAACGQSPPLPDAMFEDAPDVSAPGADATDAVTDAPPFSTPQETATFRQFMLDVQRELRNAHAPGASVAVVLHNRLTFAAGAGVRDVSSNAPVTTATLFRAASMTKMVVAATAMSLVRDGLLDVTLPITHYLPWFRLRAGFDPATLTTDRLLAHTSGFPSDTISQCAAGTSGTRQAFFAVNPQPLWAPAGLVYNYSNTGFALASVVLTAAAGMTDTAFEQLVHDRVFVPAGMTTATFDVAAAESGDFAMGYDIDPAGSVIATHDPADLACPLLNPPGGVLATASDYAHFAEMLLARGGTTMSAAGVDAMEAPHADMRGVPTRTYGYGLVRQLAPYADHPAFWHDGSLPGFASEMFIVPDLQFAVVAMVNARGDQPVADNIVGDALGRFITEARHPQPTQTPPSSWAGYVGTYNDPWGTLGAGLTVALSAGDGGVLTMAAPNATNLSGRAAPLSGAMSQFAVDEWGLPDGTAATFFPNDAGAITYLATRRGIATR